MHYSSSNHQAFTLVEMSIVLVIIGLILGGVFVGNSVLKQSELQTVIADYTKYSSAVAQFNQQYGGLPGDLLDATNYWGDDNANCPDAAVTDGSPGTCNGNSDGTIYGALDESLRAWQQLQFAKLIDGNYPGFGAAAIGTTIPSSRITAAGWSMIDSGAFVGGEAYSNFIGNMLTFGSMVNAVDNYGVTSSITLGPIITPSGAWQIDKKIDDALPGSGRIMGLQPATITPSCTIDATTYNVTQKNKYCSLLMSLSTK